MIPIFVDNPNTWEEMRVPNNTVEYCCEFTGLDPYNKNNNPTEELRLVDCYYYHMEYYGELPVIPVFE